MTPIRNIPRRVWNWWLSLSAPWALWGAGWLFFFPSMLVRGETGTYLAGIGTGFFLASLYEAGRALFCLRREMKARHEALADVQRRNMELIRAIEGEDLTERRPWGRGTPWDAS